MRVAGVVLGAALVVGCAGVVERFDQAAERVGEAVVDYCTSTNAKDREALRARVNDAASPHRVEVTCDE